MKVKLCFVIMCMCNFACKRRPRNDLCCVGRDVKPYSLSHSLHHQKWSQKSSVHEIAAWYRPSSGVRRHTSADGACRCGVAGKWTMIDWLIAPAGLETVLCAPIDRWSIDLYGPSLARCSAIDNNYCLVLRNEYLWLKRTMKMSWYWLYKWM